jgi:hypothetical protein
MKVVAWNVALCALLTVLALAALEAYLRWTIPPLREGVLFQYTPDSKRHKVMKPDAEVRVLGARVRTNELGFRDNRATLPAKRPGEFRVVVLGDSMTFGPGVEYERIYTSLLQAKLAAKHPDIQVINLAVEGYNVLQYQAVLEEVGLGLQPDLLLVALFPVNDFEMDDYDHHALIAAGGTVHTPWRQSLYVYRAYLHRLESIPAQVWHRLVAPAPAVAGDAGWENNAAALKRIAMLAEGYGVPLAVALVPHTKGFEKQRAIFGRVEGVCQQAAMRCVDLLAGFRAKGVPDGALALNAIDAHGNAEYHRIVAELLSPFVSSLIPSPRVAPQGV